MYYFDDHDRLVLISVGISGNGSPARWASYRRKTPTRSLQRIKSKFLPLRSTPEEAQADLDAYAKRKGWRGIEE